MAKKEKEKVKSQFPSYFGSHASMIDEGQTEALDDASLVALRDEHGVYITERSRLDNGRADPKRYSDPVRIQKLFAGHKKDKESAE